MGNRMQDFRVDDLSVVNNFVSKGQVQQVDRIAAITNAIECFG